MQYKMAYEKKLKYENLSIKIQRMWNIKFDTPVIIGATSVNNTRKALKRFSTANSCTRDIAYNKESATVWNLKPELWGAPVIQEVPGERKTVITDDNKNNHLYHVFIHVFLTRSILPVTVNFMDKGSYSEANSY
jgi:hypothetical protein